MNVITVLSKGSELRVDSRDIAKSLDVDHSSLQRLIKKYCDDFESFGIIGFEIQVLNTQGRPSKYTLLNEDQCYLLLTLVRNSSKTVSAKRGLVKAFSSARNSQLEWQQARLEGKVSRRSLTDVIKDFVVYAESQGSRNAKIYYANITKGTYKALYILEQGGSCKELRQKLSTMQLNQLATAEAIAMKTIDEHMDIGTHYKDIYKIAIAKVIDLSDLLGKQLPGEDNILKISK